MVMPEGAPLLPTMAPRFIPCAAATPVARVLTGRCWHHRHRPTTPVRRLPAIFGGMAEIVAFERSTSAAFCTGRTARAKPDWR